MSATPLFALPSGLEMTACSSQEGTLCVSLLSIRPTCACPVCGGVARRIHSRYQRRLTDLPSTGQPVHMVLTVRKFFCDEATCPRKIFAERLTPFVAPWARVTARLFQLVQILGLATGGRLGKRVTDRIGIPTSRITILRRIMALPTEPVGQITELGIDDFAFKRGRTYGTLLVDLRSHRTLDILLDRKAETAAAWMRSHPEIRLVSRDRGGDYASAALTAAPQAVQCADRFHLLANLSKSVEGVLSRHLATHRRQTDLVSRATSLSPAQGKGPPKKTPKHAQQSQAKREERLAQYQQVVDLRKQGFSQTAIAAEAGSRPRDCLALVEQWHLSRTKIAPAQDQARSSPPSGCRAVGSGLPQHRAVASGAGCRGPHYHLP